MFPVVNMLKIILRKYYSSHAAYGVLKIVPTWRLAKWDLRTGRRTVTRATTLFFTFMDSPLYLEAVRGNIPTVQARYMERGIFAEIDARHDKAYILSSDSDYTRSEVCL